MKDLTERENIPLHWPVELACKPDFERCMERVYAWFQQQIVDRPPVRFTRTNAQYEGGKPLDSSRGTEMQDRWFNVDYQIEQFERSLLGKIFHAETFPVFWPNLGPNVYAAFYGGRLEFAEDTSWYEPIIPDLDSKLPLNDNPFASVYFKKLEELTRAALERCKGRYLVGYTDYHPSIDCVAAWRGVQDLCLDMALHPEKLAPLVERSICDFQRIYDHFDKMLKAGGQPSVTWMGIPSCGRLHIPSCDFSSMISTKHFCEFSLPCLRREISTMSHNIYHVDGKGVAKHLDVILAQPEIQAIQWVQGLGLDQPILQWVPLLKRIQAAGKSIVLDLQFAELDQFIQQMSPEGLFLCIGAPDGLEPDLIKRVQSW